MPQPRVIATIVLCGLLLAGGVGGFVAHTLLSEKAVQNYVPQAPFQRQTLLNAFTAHGVTVELALEHDSAGHTLLSATYIPIKPHFHLYSIDFPTSGIAGAGRPTRLELLSATGVRPAGVVVADQTPQEYEIFGFREPFSMYPPGPVTLRLPITRLHDGRASATANLAITYMACNPGGTCLPPVIARPITVHISSME